MIKKIISGGQTGADRAALDVAIKSDIPHGNSEFRGHNTKLLTICTNNNITYLWHA